MPEVGTEEDGAFLHRFPFWRVSLAVFLLSANGFEWSTLKLIPHMSDG